MPSCCSGLCGTPGGSTGGCNGGGGSASPYIPLFAASLSGACSFLDINGPGGGSCCVAPTAGRLGVPGAYQPFVANFQAFPTCPALH